MKRYKKLIRKISTDNGLTYSVLSPTAYMVGDYIGECRGDDEYETIYRWLDVPMNVNWECDDETHTKYQTQKKQYSEDGGATWKDVFPYEYQRKENGETQINSIDCGFQPETRIYRWVSIDISTDYECNGTTKYYKEKSQYSDDNGRTWSDMTPLVTRTGSLYETNSEDCGYIPTPPPERKEREVEGNSYCDGTTKITPIYHQVSDDDGITWVTTGTTYNRTPSDPDCGGEQTPIYRDARGRETCNGYNKVVEIYHQVSYNNGLTWLTTGTTTETYENSIDCGFNPRPHEDCSVQYKIGGTWKTKYYDDCRIPDFAFMNHSMTDLIIGNGITSIGNYAFADNKELTAVTMPNTVSSIGYYAFDNVPKVGELTCTDDWYDNLSADEIECLGNVYYWRKKRIEPIYMDDEGRSYCDGTTKVIPIYRYVSYDGGYNWSLYDTTYKRYENDSECGYIPPSPTSETKYRVYQYTLEEKTFCEVSGDEPTPIYRTITGDYVCEGTTKLTPTYKQASYDNGETWETVETSYESEYYCKECGFIPLPSTTGDCYVITFDGESYDVDYYNDCIVDDVYKYVGETSLKEAIIGDGIIGITHSRFIGCTHLSSITVPDSVIYMGHDIFEDTPWYKNNIDLYGNIRYINNVAYKANRTGYTNYEFRENTISIAEEAFISCHNLTSIELPDSIVYMGDRAFYGCSGMTSVHLGSGITNISNEAFRSCYNLETINIPESVTKIDQGAFDVCYKLNNVVIPSSVTNIGNYAFRNCTGMTSIEIPNSVTTISSSAFYGCASLTSVTIGTGVYYIPYQLFAHCRSLNEINYNGTIEQWNSVYKETEWNLEVPATVVHCTDGDISI